MSSTFAVRTFIERTTGSGSLTFITGFRPSVIEVEQETGIEFSYFPGSPFGTRKRAAAGTTTFITTTGITWDETTKSFSLGTDAGLNGTADKLLIIKVFK